MACTRTTIDLDHLTTTTSFRGMHGRYFLGRLNGHSTRELAWARFLSEIADSERSDLDNTIYHDLTNHLTGEKTIKASESQTSQCE